MEFFVRVSSSSLATNNSSKEATSPNPANSPRQKKGTISATHFVHSLDSSQENGWLTKRKIAFACWNTEAIPYHQDKHTELHQYCRHFDQWASEREGAGNQLLTSSSSVIQHGGRSEKVQKVKSEHFILSTSSSETRKFIDLFGNSDSKDGLRTNQSTDATLRCNL